eukprot:1571947-Pyramimonas_sp.AAC.1
MALGLQVSTQTGVNLQGDAALAYPGELQQLDGQGNTLVAATESGIQILIRILSRRYGADNQQMATGTIDQFYDLRRGRLSLLDHHLLKHSGIEKSKLDHILLLVNGDLDRHEDIKDHLMRLAKSQTPAQIPGIGDYMADPYDDNDQYDDSWYDDEWQE